MAFDMQRFISNREGPNVRQSFDGIWANYEYQNWRVLGYLTHPVQYKFEKNFDDHSNSEQQFSGFRIDRDQILNGNMSGYYSLYQRENGSFPSIKGKEQRHVFDLRHTGKINQVDWDTELMWQSGEIANQYIQAWALGSNFGYSLDHTWSPRIAVQFDMASGDKNPNDQQLNTFNALFSNGSYFTLAGYSGYGNLIHIKPSITVKPNDKLTLLSALGLQWRQTSNDAIYVQGNSSIANTAGRGSSWTGAYLQLRADQKINNNISLATELVHFQAGNTIKNAGGGDSNYAGLELKMAW